MGQRAWGRAWRVEGEKLRRWEGEKVRGIRKSECGSGKKNKSEKMEQDNE